MLNLSFSVLKHSFPPKQIVLGPALFKEIGWDDLIGNDAYANTCAIRVSLALIKSGVTIPNARMPIKAGPHKGQRIEPGQGRLSHILARNSVLGQPEKFKTGQYADGIGSRSGIVFFKPVPWCL